MTKYYTVIDIARKYTRTFSDARQARAYRACIGRENKKRGQEADIRILRTVIHPDNTVETEWIQ